MKWDHWLKEFGKFLTGPWAVAFDLLQERGEQPPEVVYVVRRKPIPDDVKQYLNEWELRNVDNLYWKKTGWTTLDKCRVYSKKGPARCVATHAADYNSTWMQRPVYVNRRYGDRIQLSDIEVVTCCLIPLDVEVYKPTKEDE